MSPSLQGKAGVFVEGEVSSLGSKFAMTVLTGMVFVGALLLFSMEPLVGRLLVPFFGGAVHVWLICLMFFQAMLLIGYLYAHLFARRLGRWHLLLLLIPFISLPLGVVAEPSPGTPFLTLLGVLLTQIALPFAVLSTTAVVAQSWLAGSSLGQNNEPYPLYAASNAGSLVALLGYPFVIEPLCGVKFQSLTWTGGYVLYGLLTVLAWSMLQPGKRPLATAQKTPHQSSASSSPTTADYARWLWLSALPSAFLLTVTNFIALEVGSFPMIWVIPLALYLGSFIVTFRTRGGIPGALGNFWPHLLLTSLLLYLLPLSLAGWGMVIFIPAIFFAICLIAHGALYERRPPVQFLTSFYLTIALGGFIGGVAISIIAPLVLSGLYDYPIILGALAVVFCWSLSPDSLYFWRQTSPILKWGNILIMFGFLISFGAYGYSFFHQKDMCKFRHRNFYGTYNVIDVPPSEENPLGIRKLVHGLTLHGAQLLENSQSSRPISYYYHGGPFADVYEIKPPPRRLAVIGLGAGVVSAFTQPGDTLTYYEIDPDNERIARQWFTFLDRSTAPVNVIVGDGRLSLQKAPEGNGPYDIITIDAFTGDGIPTHLLTQEALKVYLSRLAPDGLLLFHISNRYYDLGPLMKSLGEELELSGVMNKPAIRSTLNPYDRPAQCVVFSRSAKNLQPLIQRGWILLGHNDDLPETAYWTDDYINILSPLSARLRNWIAR